MNVVLEENMVRFFFFKAERGKRITGLSWGFRVVYEGKENNPFAEPRRFRGGGGKEQAQVKLFFIHI